MNPIEIDAEIQRVLTDLEESTTDFGQYGEAAARAEVAYKVGYAKALLVADGKTVGERESEATVDCGPLLLDRKIKENQMAAQKELLLTLRARLDALRTLAANVRVQT